MKQAIIPLSFILLLAASLCAQQDLIYDLVVSGTGQEEAVVSFVRIIKVK